MRCERHRADGIVFVRGTERVQELVGDDHVVPADQPAAGVTVDHAEHAFLHADRVFERKRALRAVIADEDPDVGIDTILVAGYARHPPSHPERPEHDVQDIAAVIDRRRLLGDRRTQFDADRPLDAAAIAPHFTGHEFLYARERVRAKSADVVLTGVTAVAIDRVDLHPEAVVPVRAPQLREPGARGDHEQDEKQDRDTYGFQHAVSGPGRRQAD